LKNVLTRKIVFFAILLWVFANELMLDMAIYKAECARIRLKSGINSSAKTYNCITSQFEYYTEGTIIPMKEIPFETKNPPGHP
jgi:hypothetical protein